MLLSLIGSLALAGEVELERGRRVLEEGRPAEASVLLHDVVLEDPSLFGAWASWLNTCEVMGMSVACRAEMALLEEEHEAVTAALMWHDRAQSRTEYDPADLPEVLVQLDDGLFKGSPSPLARRAQLARMVKNSPDAAASAGLSYLKDDPAHPEVLTALFSSAAPARKSIGKAKKKLLSVGSKRTRSAPAEELYRWHEVFLRSPSASAAKTAERLAEAGEDPPLDRHPYTRAEQVHAARALLASGDLDGLPSHVPSEREGVILKLADLQASTGRISDLDKTFVVGRSQHDTVSLALSHGRVLLDAGLNEQALEVAQQALDLAVTPWPTDVAVTKRLRRREAVAQALVLRGRIRLASGDLRESAIDLIVANQLSLRPIGTDALEKAMEKGRYGLEEVKFRWETPAQPAQEVALEAAREALEEERFSDVDAAAADAIAALCVPSHSKARLTARLAGLPELASAYALRALSSSRSGKDQAALTQVSIATLLLPWDSPADWWTLQGETHTALGNDHAAFFAGAMAASLDEDAAAPTSDLWPHGSGLGAGPALVAEWMRGHEDLEPPKDRLIIRRGRVVTFRGPSASGGSGTSRPLLNTAFPAWSVSTAHGTVKPVPGRMYFVTFFRADSASSIRLLDELTGLARELRSRGADIVLVGISMDPKEAAMDGLRAKMEGWGPVGWDPGMAARFGVNAVPTTWVVDAEGIARFQHVGYLGTSEYEAEIRFISGL